MSKDVKYPGNLIKEIEESPEVLRRVIKKYTKNGKYNFDKSLLEKLENAENVYFLACGTSYHSALAAKNFFYDLRAHYKMRVASEWALNPYAHMGKTVYVMISQSGETGDLKMCLPHVSEEDTLILITNSPNSTLAKKSDYVLDVVAGEEKAIASTKVYIAQLAVLALLAGALKKDTSVIKELEEIADKQEEVIANRDQYYEASKQFLGIDDAYLLGRGIDYPIALEATLKLKETTYIHSEAFYGGEFKHGPISLIEEGVPTILFLSEAHVAPHVRENQKQIEKYGGKVFVITSKSLEQEGDILTVPDCKEIYSPFLKIMVVQYIAYFLAYLKGLDSDSPRHLTKAVTE